jgi:hypothetical protein
MRHQLFSRPAGMVLLALTAAALPTRATSPAFAGALHQASAAATAFNFNAALTGMTSNKRYTINLEVSRDAVDGSVQLTVLAFSAATQHPSGSTYTFTLPASDLSVTTKGATLDTHTDLGSYGHVSASWSYTSHSTTVQNASACTGGLTTTVQHTLATASAILTLTFPCEGKLSAYLSGTNLDVTQGALPPAAAGSSTTSLVHSLYFTAAIATKSTKTGTISVGGYTAGGRSLLLVSQTIKGSTGKGLTSSTHFSSDTLQARALTTGVNPAAVLHYQGALGTANLTFTGKSQAFSITMPAICINPTAKGATRNTSLSVKTAQAAVSGTVSLSACGAVKATFGAGDIGSIMTTSPVSGGSGAGPTSGGPGTSFGSEISVTKVSPPDGATNVPTTTSFSVVLSAAPKNSHVMMIVTEANNPRGIVMLPPPTFDAATKTATTTPATPLKPNTRYKLQVIVTGTGAFAQSTSYFTTGAS